MSNIPGASPYAANAIVAGPAGTNAAHGGQTDQEAAAMGNAPMSPRQVELTRRYSYYRCTNYSDLQTNWNGHPIIPFSERAAISHEGYLPPGFTDEAGAMMPLEFRKPYAPYYLIRIIVNRFTGLLFSERRTPTISVLGDELSTDYVQAVAKVGKLWASMRRARRLGGSMGTGVVSFGLINGRPNFEVHDPRWCWPTFVEGDPCRLKSLDKRYLFRDWIRTPEGEVIQDADHPPIESWFWYRRFIDTMTDTVWSRVPVQSPNDYVDWNTAESISVKHGIGRCPARWIQNLPSEENELDGEPDAWGSYDLTETHDKLMSQATMGTIANCTPTVHVATEDPINEIDKSATNKAIKTEAGGTVEYLEMTGSGPKIALELAREHRELAYELCACIPDRTADGPEKTATEVLARLSSMLERGGELRDQWGDAIKDLLEIALIACRNSTTPKATDKGITQGTISLPPKVQDVDGTPKLVERKLGPGTHIDLKWPSFYEPSLEDIVKAANAAGVLKDGQVLDLQTLLEFLANYFPITDAKAVMRRLETEIQDQQGDVEQRLIEGMMRRQAAKTGFETKAQEHGVKLKATGMGGFEVTGAAKPKQMNGKPQVPKPEGEQQ